MSEQEEHKNPEESELESEVQRMIKADSEAEKYVEHSIGSKKINSCKRDFAVYSIVGCADAVVATNFVFASLTPIQFGNVAYSGVLIGAAVVNVVLSYYLFKSAADKLEYIVAEKNKEYFSK